MVKYAEDGVTPVRVRAVFKTVENGGETTVPAGTGFWYLNSSGSKNVKW